MIPGEFAAIEARANAATPGPWEHCTKGYDGLPLVVAEGYGFPAEPLGQSGTHVIETMEADAEFIAHSRTDIPALLAAVRERDNTIARVREVSLLGLDEIAQKSIDATVARMQDQLGCTPDDLGPDVMAKIVDSHIEQAELFAGPVLDALRAALDPQETP